MTVSESPDVPREIRRISAVLRGFIEGCARERVSVGDFRDVLTDRAYGALMFVFALPNLMPVNLPGVAQIFGLLLILLSAQLVYGRPTPYIPDWLARRSFKRTDFEKAVFWGLRYLEGIERVLRPRLVWLIGATGERLLGLVCLILSVAIAVPAPLSNWLPALERSPS